MDKTLEQIQKFIEQACDKQRNASDMPGLPTHHFMQMTGQKSIR